MEYRRLGESGLVVSAIGLGCNNFGRVDSITESQQATDAIVHSAIDHGITLFDTADAYGGTPGLSETLIGNALRGGRRDRIVLATKFGLGLQGANGPDWGARGSRRYIRRAVEGSLKRLQTDWIDLYQLHRPDPLTPIGETIAALDDLIGEGKIRYIGHSNLAAWQIVEAEFVARAGGHSRFISAQNEYNLLQRKAEEEVLPAVRAFGIGFLPYFPLHNGLLTGKYAGGSRPPRTRITTIMNHILDTAPWDALDQYGTFCRDRGISMVQATFAWMLAQPGLTSVIAGASSPEQVAQNVAAVSAWEGSDGEFDQIANLFRSEQAA